MTAFRCSLFFAMAIEIAANTCPAVTGLSSKCSAKRTGYCSGNEPATTDVTCNAKRALKDNSHNIEKTTEADCCEDKVGYCADNKEGADHTCSNTDLTIMDNPETVEGTTDDACCGKTCADWGVTCDEGKTFASSIDAKTIVRNATKELKCCGGTIKCCGSDGHDDVVCDTGKTLIDLASDEARGADAQNQDNCCKAKVTGKCTGNTDTSENVNCFTSGMMDADDYATKTGTDAAACCKDTCNNKVTCDAASDKPQNKGYTGETMNYGEADFTTEKCCEAAITGKCAGNTDSSNDVVCAAGTKSKGAGETIDAGDTDDLKQTNCCDDIVRMCSGNKAKAEDVSCGTCAEAGCALKEDVETSYAEGATDDDKCGHCCMAPVPTPSPPAVVNSARGVAVLSSASLAMMSAVWLF